MTDARYPWKAFAVIAVAVLALSYAGTKTSLFGDGEIFSFSATGQATIVPQITEKARYAFIESGGCGTVSFAKYADLGVRDIQLCVGTTVRDVELTVTLVRSITGPLPPTDPAYKTLSISAERLSVDNIRSVVYTYAVNKTWIASKKIDPSRIRLQRLVSDEWIPLETQFIDEDENFRIYYSTSPGFTLYTITGAPTQCPPCPGSSLWSACEGNVQARTVYTCSEETGFECRAAEISRNCGPQLFCPVCPDDTFSSCVGGRRHRTSYACSSGTGYACQPSITEEACPITAQALPQLTSEQIESLVRAVILLAIIIGLAIVIELIHIYLVRRRRIQKVEIKRVFVKPIIKRTQGPSFWRAFKERVKGPKTVVRKTFVTKKFQVHRTYVTKKIVQKSRGPSFWKSLMKRMEGPKVIVRKTRIYVKPKPSHSQHHILRAIEKRIAGPRVVVKSVKQKHVKAPKEAPSPEPGRKKNGSMFKHLFRNKHRNHVKEVPVPVVFPVPEEEEEHPVPPAPRSVRPLCEICGKPQPIIHTCTVCGREVCTKHAEVVGGKLYCSDHATKQK